MYACHRSKTWKTLSESEKFAPSRFGCLLVRDIAPLTRLAALEKLDVRHTKIATLEPLG